MLLVLIFWIISLAFFDDPQNNDLVWGAVFLMLGVVFYPKGN